MPTHFSKLEGSLSNIQLERRRRRRSHAATTKVRPSSHFDESVGSNVTVHEDDNIGSRSFYRRDRSGEIPQFIQVQNSKHLPQTRHRPTQYDAYCQTRVSAISSFLDSSHNPSRSIERDQRDDDGHYVPPPQARERLPSFSSRREHTISKRNTVRRLPETTNRNPTNRHRRIVYDLTSMSAPSEPSTLTNNSSSVRSHRGVRTLVNTHGNFGSSSSNNKRYHKNINKRRIPSDPRNCVNSNLNSARHLEQSLTGDPYSRGVWASLERKDDNSIDETSYDSQNDVSLVGERFADASSEYNDPPKKMRGLHCVNDSANVRTNSFRQKQKHTATKWLCDVCKEARFDTYVEAYRHEKKCKKRKNKTVGRNSTKELEALTYQRGDVVEKRENSESRVRIDNDYFISNYGARIGNHLQEMSLSSSTESSPSNHCRIATTPIAQGIDLVSGSGNYDSSASKEATKLLCHVRKDVSFDNYQDACSCEKICKIQMEATADFRAAGIGKPSNSGAPLPPLYRAQTRSGSFDKIGKVATADLWKESEKLKGGSFSSSSFFFAQQSLDHGNRHNTLANNPPERRQDENDREVAKSQIRYEGMDVIEKERELHSQTNSSLFGKPHGARNPSETRDDRYHTFNANTRNNDSDVPPQDFLFLSERTKNHKGEAYDRYVLLASQQEEEEERERYIALAKQTREEELLSYRHGDTSEERYVCLA